MLEESQRACFNCGKTGHQSRLCSDKQRGPQQRPSAGAPPRGGPPRGNGRPGRGQGAHLVQDGSEITTLMVTCEDEDGFAASRSRCRRNAATDLSFFRACAAGLTQRERRAEGNSFRNTFDVLADVCPDTHVAQTSVLKPAHSVVHASYAAAAGGASLASNSIIDISSTPFYPHMR